MHFIELTDIPFDKLAGIGITRQMFGDLSKHMKLDIIFGQLSSLLQFGLTRADGSTLCFLGKLSLVLDRAGGVSVVLIPQLNEAAEEEYMQQLGLGDGDRQLLEQGALVVLGDKPRRVYCFLDRETRTVLTVKEDGLVLPDCVWGVRLSCWQRQNLLGGDPVETVIDGRVHTVYIDPCDMYGYNICPKSIEDWAQRRGVAWVFNQVEIRGYWYYADGAWQHETHRDRLQAVKDHGGITLQEAEEVRGLVGAVNAAGQC